MRFEIVHLCRCLTLLVVATIFVVGCGLEVGSGGPKVATSVDGQFQVTMPSGLDGTIRIERFNRYPGRQSAERKLRCRAIRVQGGQMDKRHLAKHCLFLQFLICRISRLRRLAMQCWLQFWHIGH